MHIERRGPTLILILMMLVRFWAALVTNPRR